MNEIEKHAKIEKELFDLIELAEISTKQIDNLSKTLESYRNIIMFFYLFLIASSLILYYSLYRYARFDFRQQSEADLFLVLIAVAISLIVGFAFVIYRRVVFSRKLSRELNVERDIQIRLMSLIDDQRQRVETLTEISPVAQATLEMRLRRLDRTKKRFD